MSFRSGLYVFAIVGLIVTASYAAFFSWSEFSAYQKQHANERITAAEYQADAAESGLNACRTIMGESGVFDWFACLAENVAAEGNDKHAEYDLKAQQDMAAWAYGMLIVTVWLSVITLLGVFFVWLTLRATRQMSNETTRIGEAQSRAYIVIKSAFVFFENPSFQKVKIDLTNTGATPARGVRVHANISPFKVNGEPDNIIFEESAYDIGAQGEYKFSHSVMGTQEGIRERTGVGQMSWRESGDEMFATITIIYKDIFKRRWEHTANFRCGSDDFTSGENLEFISSNESEIK